MMAWDKHVAESVEWNPEVLCRVLDETRRHKSLSWKSNAMGPGSQIIT